MLRIFRVVSLLLLAFIFRSQLWWLVEQAATVYTRNNIQTPIVTDSLLVNNSMATQPRPTGLIATSGLELLTFNTGNGQKVSIFLEELRLAYHNKPHYAVQSINIFQGVQKEPWYTTLNPNGKIPTLVDHDRGGLAIMEGMAILLYLARNFDPEHKFSFAEEPYRSECEQWMAWQTGGIGAMQGQANHFYRMSPYRLPYPMYRYVTETERLWTVLDGHLSDRDYVVGPGRGKYSIADMVLYGWINTGWFAGIKIENFAKVERWWKSLSEREGVRRGLNVPAPPFGSKESHEKRLKEDAEYRAKEEELERVLREAKEEFGGKVKGW